MNTIGPLFEKNQLDSEQQRKFDIIYNELKPKYTIYVEYKLNLRLKTKLDSEEEENEWRYEIHRHLRARKWNVPQTIKSLQEMIQWRMDNQIDSILEHTPTINRMDILRTMVPNVYHGYTKENRPLYIERSGRINVDKLLNMFTTAELIQCHVYTLEFSCKLARERSRQVGKHIETFCMISDLRGCKLSMRKLLHVYKQGLYIDDHYYPERLGHMFVVNPPSIFPVLYNIVKPWLDPVTKAKIIIIEKGPDATNKLQKYIDSDQLPREYGGNCSTCSNSPNCLPVYDCNQDNSDSDDEKKQ